MLKVQYVLYVCIYVTVTVGLFDRHFSNLSTTLRMGINSHFVVARISSVLSSVFFGTNLHEMSAYLSRDTPEMSV